MFEKMGLTGSIYKTNWPLLILIFLAPLRNIQLQYLPNFGGGLNVINILFFLSVAHAYFHGKKIPNSSFLDTWIVVYILTSILALIMGYQFLGADANGNWKDLKDQLIPVFIVFVIQRSAADMVQWRRILIAALISTPYVFKVTYNQYKAVSSYHYSHDLRIRGPFMDLGANELGAYAIMVGMIALGCLLLTWKDKGWRYIFIALFAMCVSCVMYSYSRAGYLALILGIVVVIAFYKYRSKLILPLIILITIFSFNMPKSVSERFTMIFAEDDGTRDESADSRFVFWDIAFDNYKKKPLIGYGYRTVRHPSLNPYEMDTHNYFIKVIVERGALGISVLAILLIIILYYAKKNLRWNERDPLINGVSLGMIGIVFSLLLGNMFGDRFSHYPIMFIFWSMIGLILTANNRPELHVSHIKDDYEKTN